MQPHGEVAGAFALNLADEFPRAGTTAPMGGERSERDALEAALHGAPVVRVEVVLQPDEDALEEILDRTDERGFRLAGGREHELLQVAVAKQQLGIRAVGRQPAVVSMAAGVSEDPRGRVFAALGLLEKGAHLPALPGSVPGERG